MHLGSVRIQPAVASLAEPHRERITRWWRQGIQGTTIHAALVRSHGFTGSYSSVRRFLAALEAAHPQVTTVLEFDPGEAAQVDFGKGPEVVDPRTGELLSSWIFVMTLAWSRHACCFPLYLVGAPYDLTGLFRRRFSWDDGAIRDTSDRGEVVFLMNDCCRSGGDVVARVALAPQSLPPA